MTHVDSLFLSHCRPADIVSSTLVLGSFMVSVGFVDFIATCL